MKHMNLYSQVGHIVVMLPLVVVGKKGQCSIAPSQYAVGLTLKSPMGELFIEGITLCPFVGPHQSIAHYHSSEYRQ